MLRAQEPGWCGRERGRGQAGVQAGRLLVSQLFKLRNDLAWFAFTIFSRRKNRSEADSRKWGGNRVLEEGGAEKRAGLRT